MAEEPRPVVDEPDQEGLHVIAAASQDLAQAMMEVKMHELKNMLDFVAADLALFESITGGQGALAHPAQWALTQQPVRFQISAHARIGRTLRAGGSEHHAQVVVVQLGGPARMLSVLRGQNLYRLSRQTREATDVAAYLVAQRVHRIAGLLRGVIPPFECRAAEADLDPRERMTPCLGGQRVQGLV